MLLAIGIWRKGVLPFSTLIRFIRDIKLTQQVTRFAGYGMSSICKNMPAMSRAWNSFIYAETIMVNKMRPLVLSLVLISRRCLMRVPFLKCRHVHRTGENMVWLKRTIVAIYDGGYHTMSVWILYLEASVAINILSRLMLAIEQYHYAANSHLIELLGCDILTMYDAAWEGLYRPDSLTTEHLRGRRCSRYTSKPMAPRTVISGSAIHSHGNSTWRRVSENQSGGL